MPEEKGESMGRLVKNYFYNVLYQVFILVVPLVTAPYLARVLGANGNGTFSYVQSTATLISTMAMLGIFAYGNRQIAYFRDNRVRLTTTYNQIMSARLVLTLLSTVLYFAIVIIIGKYTTYFFIYYTYVLAYGVDVTWLYVGIEDMKWAVIKNTVTKLFSIIGIFTLVHSTNDLGVYVLIQGLSILISNVLAYSQVGRYVGKFAFDFSHLVQDLKGSAILFLPSVAATIYLQCDKILIELITGATNQVSYYDYSEKIITIPLAFITVISTVMMPRIANEFKKNNTAHIEMLLSKVSAISFFAAFPMMFGLIAVAGSLVPWYLGPDFQPTAAAIMMIAPIIVANTISGISGSQYFTATNQIRILLTSQVSAAVGNVVLNLILVPRFGFYGSAVATVVTSYVCAGIQWYYLRQQIKLPGLGTETTKSLIASLIMFVSIWVTTSGWSSTPATTFFQVIIGLFVYLIVSILLHNKTLFELFLSIKQIINSLVEKNRTISPGKKFS